jgi:hypothetical protein
MAVKFRACGRIWLGPLEVFEKMFHMKRRIVQENKTRNGCATKDCKHLTSSIDSARSRAETRIAALRAEIANLPDHMRGSGSFPAFRRSYARTNSESAVLCRTDKSAFDFKILRQRSITASGSRYGFNHTGSSLYSNFPTRSVSTWLLLLIKKLCSTLIKASSPAGLHPENSANLR